MVHERALASNAMFAECWLHNMMDRMDCRYKVVKQLGDGTYGSVWKAMNRQTNEVVRWYSLA